MKQAQLLQPKFEITMENKTTKTRETIFQKEFLNAVDATFEVLGNSNRQTLYRCLETKFNLSKNKIPESIVPFENALERIFGQAASLIEIQIIQRLHKAFPEFEFSCREAFSLSEYVKSLNSFL